MLPGGFLPAAPSLSRRTFNDWPQCGGFGLTSAGACAFSGNVASVSRLGLFSSGLLQHLLEQSHGFSRGSLKFGCAIGKNDFRKDVQFVPDVANLADGCECHDDSSCSRGRHGLYAFAYLICLSYQVWRDQEENGRETAKEKEQEMCSSSLQNRDFQAPQSHTKLRHGNPQLQPWEEAPRTSFFYS